MKKWMLTFRGGNVQSHINDSFPENECIGCKSCDEGVFGSSAIQIHCDEIHNDFDYHASARCHCDQIIWSCISNIHIRVPVPLKLSIFTKAESCNENERIQKPASHSEDPESPGPNEKPRAYVFGLSNQKPMASNNRLFQSISHHCRRLAKR